MVSAKNESISIVLAQENLCVLWPAMTGPEGNREFCLPRIAMFREKQNSLLPKGPVLK